MSTKNGYYSDGYYDSNVKQMAPMTLGDGIVLAFATDNKKLYVYSQTTNARPTLFTGLLSSFYKDANGFLNINSDSILSSAPDSFKNSATVYNGNSSDSTFGRIPNLGAMRTEAYFKNGVLASGTASGKLFTSSGLAANGIVNSKLYVHGSLASYIWQDAASESFGGNDVVTYKNGVPFNGLIPYYDPTSGVFFSDWQNLVLDGDLVTNGGNIFQTDSNGVRFVNGKAGAGWVGGKQYGNDGKVVTGIFNNKYYSSGVPASGVLDGVLYKNGSRFTGTNVIWSDIRNVDAGPLGSNGIYFGASFAAAQSNCIFNWPGFVSNPAANGVTTYQWTAIPGLSEGTEPSMTIFYSNGVPANGVVNGKRYNNGVLFSGDQIFSNVMYRNGNAFGGNLTANSNSQVTFAGTTFTVPSVGVVTFVAGRVAHGLIGGKFFDKGKPVLSTGTYTLHLSAGVPTNGTVSGVTYINGLQSY